MTDMHKGDFSLTSIKSPCKGCESRCESCWSVCMKYANYKDLIAQEHKANLYLKTYKKVQMQQKAIRDRERSRHYHHNDSN